jgi:hypothetical protein
MSEFDWKQRFADQVRTAEEAVKAIKPGNSVVKK